MFIKSLMKILGNDFRKKNCKNFERNNLGQYHDWFKAIHYH